MANKTHEELERELSATKMHVKVGGIYYHYKNPKALYEVIGLGIQEGTEKVCVIYRAQYNKDLVFVRDLGNWLEKPSENVSRFNLVKA